jgi:hypothetical protein
MRGAVAFEMPLLCGDKRDRLCYPLRVRRPRRSKPKFVYLGRDFRFSLGAPDGWIVRTDATDVTASHRRGRGTRGLLPISLALSMKEEQ